MMYLIRNFIVVSVMAFSFGAFASTAAGSSVSKPKFTQEQKACLNYATEAGNFHVSYQKFRQNNPDKLMEHINTINEASKSGQRGTVFLALSAKMKELKPRSVKYTVTAICLDDKNFDRVLDISKLKSCESKSDERNAIRCIQDSI